MLASDKRRAVHNFHKLDTPAAVTLMSRGVIEFVNSFHYLLLGLWKFISRNSERKKSELWYKKSQLPSYFIFLLSGRNGLPYKCEQI